MVLNLDLLQVYKSGEYADLTIIAGATRYKVHKLIICQFEPIKELVANAEDDTIKLPECPAVVHALLGGIYGFDYDTGIEDFQILNPDDVEAEAEILVDTCLAAEKYGVREVADRLATLLRTAIEHLPGTAAKLAIISRLCGDDLRGQLQKEFLRTVTDEGAWI